MAAGEAAAMLAGGMAYGNESGSWRQQRRSAQPFSNVEIGGVIAGISAAAAVARNGGWPARRLMAAKRPSMAHQLRWQSVMKSAVAGLQRLLANVGING